MKKSGKDAVQPFLSCSQGHQYAPLSEEYRKEEKREGSSLLEGTGLILDKWYRSLFCIKCGETKEVISRIVYE